MSGVGVSDARISFTVGVAAGAMVSVLGFFIAPDLSVTVDPLVLGPLLVGVVGYLLGRFVVDPLARPRRTPDARAVIRWLGRTVQLRVLVLAMCSPAGLVFAALTESYLALVTGAVATVALGVVWWPGPKCFEELLGVIEPRAGAAVVAAVRTKNKGRIIVQGRSTGSVTG